jgi:hypothetical protein
MIIQAEGGTRSRGDDPRQQGDFGDPWLKLLEFSQWLFDVCKIIQIDRLRMVENYKRFVLFFLQNIIEKIQTTWCNRDLACNYQLGLITCHSKKLGFHS